MRTISVTTYGPPRHSGGVSVRSCAASQPSLRLPVAAPRLSCCSGSSALTPLEWSTLQGLRVSTAAASPPVRSPHVGVPAELGPELLDDAYRELEERRHRRDRRDAYHAGWRCWGCRKFVSGPHATCRSCGYAHGGINHVAYATR